MTDPFDAYKDFLLSLIRESSLHGVFEACKRFFLQQKEAACCCVWLVDILKNESDPQKANSENGLHLFEKLYRTKTSPETWTHQQGTYAWLPFEEQLIGKAATERRQVWAHSSEQWERPEWALNEGIVEYIASPMIVDGDLIGVFGVFLFEHDHQKDSEGLLLQRILADSLAAAVSKARASEEIRRLKIQLEMENEYLREEVKEVYTFGQIVGASNALHRIIKQVEIAAPTDVSVLITGESGTGKELIARYIHENSARADRPFIKVNCAAVPRELFESEFFGHVRGSFSGAIHNRTGRFQLADKGTIFLDEVGEIPPGLQVKLLRVLQEGRFERIGDEKTIQVSVRVIAATNRNLIEDIKRGRFRQDLYYRLAVFPIEIPPLRQRIEDILPLAHHFIEKACRRLGQPKAMLTKNQLQTLHQYHWPGNVRELQNIIERAVIISKGGDLSFSFLPKISRDASGAIANNPKGNQIIRENEWIALQRKNILNALQKCNWKIQGKGGAADLLGLKPTTLRSRIKALGIIHQGERLNLSVG